jgi:hypothetical protein
MAYIGNEMQLLPLRQDARSVSEGGRYLTRRCLNPLTSFVLHMMCCNCVSAGQRHRMGSLVAIDSEPSVSEKDDIVGLIEEWEADVRNNVA